MANLAELQVKLAAVDLKESGERAVVPVVLVGSATALGLAGLPVALLGAADLLATLSGLSPGTSKLIVAAVALVLAGLLAFLGLRSVGMVVEPLRRSREELARNLAWVRTVLVHSGRSYTSRRP